MILYNVKDLYGPSSNGAEDSDAFRARLALSAVFDHLRPFQRQLARIASFRELTQRLDDLASVFDDLRKFAIQVGELARVLESIDIFQDRLRPVPNQFAQLDALDEKLKRLCASFAE